MNKLLQVYGKNTGAQEIVQTELTSAFPSLVEQFDMVNRIYEKFYDWMFPFVYTEDGGADMTWRANVRSWIAKNPKLAELEAHFAQGTLSGTLTEQIDDTDNTTFTDNRATKQSTTFKGVDTTGSGALADSVTNEFETGKNTTKDERTYNRTRTYADGRNWVQVMKEVQAAEEPVYTFINSFARLLVSPTWCKQDFCEVLPPSVEMSVKTVSVPAGGEPTAEIVNRGTPFNADWLLSMGLVAGEPGPQGPPGEPGPQGPQGEPGPSGAGKQLYAHSGRLEDSSSIVFNYYCICDKPTLFTEAKQLVSYDFSLIGYRYDATSNYPLLQYEKQGTTILCSFLTSKFTSTQSEVSFRSLYINDNVTEL